MLKSSRIFSLACSSLKQQASVRPLSVSAKCRAEVSREEINKLFVGDDRTSAPRRGRYSLNRVELIGGIAGDVKTRTGKNGREFLSFTVVTNRSARNASGDFFQLEPEFHAVVAFNGIETGLRDLQRGKRVYLCGRIHYTQTVLADGTKSSRANIVAENFHVIQQSGRPESVEEENPTVAKKSVADVDEAL